MTTAALTTPARWVGVLSGIHADVLDCLQSTLAVIADDAYGQDAHLALGRAWRFPARGPDGISTMQASLDERLTQARQFLDLHPSSPEGPLNAADLRALASAGPLYVVAEAFDLGWLPYAHATVRSQAMPHSFLLTRASIGYTVVDAYHNDTEWGSARPAQWTMTSAEFDAAVTGQAQAITITAGSAPPGTDPAAALTANAAAARAATRAIDDYAADALAGIRRPDGMERLVLDVWLACRERLLHAAWLGGHPAAAAVAEAADHWRQLAAHSYVASRRARRGIPPSPGLADDIIRRLEADAALASSLAPAAQVHSREAIAGSVARAVSAALGLESGTSGPLRALPGFSSFRLVEIIDKLEADLGLEFPGDATAEDLADLAGLCSLFTRAAERVGRLGR